MGKRGGKNVTFNVAGKREQNGAIVYANTISVELAANGRCTK
jgi:hypothetical protein